MTEATEKRPRKRRRLWITLAVLAFLLAAFIIPSMINVNRYKGRITQLVSQSLGRPVQISGIHMRLLPWPGFVLSNLVVASDPAFGAEPVLHADSVDISFNLLALWSGRLEISRISVDNASLNLVRAPNGRWNLDSLFRSAAVKAAGVGRSTQRRAPHLPYLEASNSRINFKNGVVKLPFSIVNADLAFWQEAPGDWHIRLRGQPARTDVSLDQEDTGVVRLNASLHSAAALRDMPLHVDMDWRQAQLGQLSRLLLGSDPGWRGALTAELHIDGTAETAHVTARLRATGVHRAEFAPAEPLDFDANCGVTYHYSHGSFDHLVCNSPLGNGHVRLAGSVPGGGANPRFSLALDHVPVDAGLAFLRTIRSGVDPGLSARGTISGKMAYAAVSSQKPTGRSRFREQRHVASAHASNPLPLTGSFTVSGFRLSGGGLNSSIRASRTVFKPEEVGPDHATGLTATMNVPAGATTPLILIPSVTLKGYRLAVRGRVSLKRARELAHLAGISNPAELKALSGGPVTLALNVRGPWLPNQEYEVEVPQTPGANGLNVVAPAALTGVEPTPPSVDKLSGTATVHDAHWKPDYLARRVLIPRATLHLDNGKADWDPVDFEYGPLRGTASLAPPEDCVVHKPCPAHFNVRFGNLKADELQRAILGARAHTSLFAALINRLHLSSAPDWPRLVGTVRAQSLTLGAVKLQDPLADLKINANGAIISRLDARLLGGELRASGTLTKPGTDQGRPSYVLDARFIRLSAPAVGKLFGMRFAGSTLDASGKVHLRGLTARELASSARGTLYFDWRHGAIRALPESHAASAGTKTLLADAATAPVISEQGSADQPVQSPVQGSAQGSVQGSARGPVQGSVRQSAEVADVTPEPSAKTSAESGANAPGNAGANPPAPTAGKAAAEAPDKTPAKSPVKEANEPQARHIPPQLAHFVRFTGEVGIADGKVTLRNGQVLRDGHRHDVEAELNLRHPSRVTFTVPGQNLTAKGKTGSPLKK